MPFIVRLFAPVVATVAVASKSAATGGTVPVWSTQSTLSGLADVPLKFNVTAPAVLSAWSPATQILSPAAEAVIPAATVRHALAQSAPVAAPAAPERT